MHDVAIIGGGLAGLSAAQQLHALGLDLIVLEARERLGGRILSAGRDGEPAADGHDLGPAWFWPEAQPDLANLVRRQGLATFAQHDQGDMLFERASGVVQRVGGFATAPPSVRIAGGIGALIAALVEALPPERLCTGAAVVRLELRDDRVDLVLATGARLSARTVVLAAPPRLLVERITFDPPLARSDARFGRAPRHGWRRMRR